MKRPINEIFYSLQGEGHNTGRATVFIRFSGCNLKCPFCDTDHRTFSMMSDEEIITEIKQYPSQWVTLTGGEPTLFIDEQFIDLLHAAGLYVAIETNGTRPVPANTDWVTLSPKNQYTDDSNARLHIEKCNEIKVVYDGNISPLKYDNPSIEADYYYLQPCDTGNNIDNKLITKEVIEFILANPKWKLSLQTHKVLDIK